jgi:hypothetical protein
VNLFEARQEMAVDERVMFGDFDGSWGARCPIQLRISIYTYPTRQQKSRA